MMSSTEELTEAVSQHQVLYDTAQPDYMKVSCEDETWARILNQIRNMYSLHSDLSPLQMSFLN